MTTWRNLSGQPSTASATVQRASKILLSRQDADGWWCGRRAGDITLDAEGLLVREFLGLRTHDLTCAAAQQIRAQQQADGSWVGGDFAVSVLAYLSLRLAGDSADAYHMAVAAGWIRDAGGIAATTVVTRAWLALFGLTGWADVRVPAPEVIFLPPRYSLTAADWVGWSRQTVVALTVIGTLRPLRRLPFDLNELRASAQESADPDRRLPVRVPRLSAARSAARATALRSCGQWIINWQLRDGLPAVSRPAWACSLVALHALGYPTRHPVLSGGLAWFDSVTAQPRPAAGAARPVPRRQPPPRDTALAIQALADADLPGDHPTLVNAASWLLAQRIEGPPHEGPGPQRGPAPSGWCFGTDGYPAVADTATVLMALSRVTIPDLAGRPAIGNAARWLAGSQGRDGSWGCSALVTAKVVQALATHGPPGARAIRRGLIWLLRAQLPDGSWPAGPGDSQLCATTTVVGALLMAGVPPSKPVIRTAVDWLLGQQNLDAGWRSGPALADVLPHDRQSMSDAPGTAQAVAALLTAGGRQVADPVDAGADWLVRAQQADGGWSDRPGGRPVPRRRDMLVPGLLLPLSTLGRYVTARDQFGEEVLTLNAVSVAKVVSVAEPVSAEPVPFAEPVSATGD